MCAEGEPFVRTGCHRCDPGVRTSAGIRTQSWPRTSARRTFVGRCLDTVPRMHQLHGAEIRALVPGYRPGDLVNEGNGVLVARRSVEPPGTSANPPKRRAEARSGPYSAERATHGGDTRLLRRDTGGTTRESSTLWKVLSSLSWDSTRRGRIFRRRSSPGYGIALAPLFFFEHNTGALIVSIQRISEVRKTRERGNRPRAGSLRPPGRRPRGPGALTNPATWQSSAPPVGCPAASRTAPDGELLHLRGSADRRTPARGALAVA